MTYDEILDYAWEFDDCDATSLREYFKCLLEALWNEGEGFSGKRPFGNSGWEYDVYGMLVTIGIVEGTFYEDGSVESFDGTFANDLVFELINHIFTK